jgi:hypothetical protein
MRAIDDPDKTYHLCLNQGKIRDIVPDADLVLSLKTVTEKCLGFIDRVALTLAKDSTDWTFVFRDYYESLRMLIEALLLLDGIEADNHQCKNACLCMTHPDLALDWEFLETIRLLRNMVNYRGRLLTYDDWKSLSLGFRLHIDLLRKEIGERMNVG